MTEWNKQPRGSVHSEVIQYVQAVEQNQFDKFDRFEKLAILYDPSQMSGTYARETGGGAHVITNVIASSVDTVAAAISATEVRCRFMTDGAEFSEQRQAHHLGYYSDGLVKRYRVHKHAQRAFKACSLKGTGLVKVSRDVNGEICVDSVMIDDIIVDDAESRGKPPQQMHHRMFIDKAKLASKFPKKKSTIESAQESEDFRRSGSWAGYRPVGSHEVVVIESWYLPLGVKGKPGYAPGRHVVCIDGVDLFDEAWDGPRFPFAVIRWTERQGSYYGISGAERITGHQRSINRLGWQIHRQIDQHSAPTTYIRQEDSDIAIKTTNRAGTFMVYRGDIPKTVIPQAVSPEQFNWLAKMESSAYEEFGVSKLAATSAKPAGLESAVALREYRDQTTQRFAIQEQDFEKMVLDIVWLILHECKQLGAEAPVVRRKSRYGKKQFRWEDVDMSEVDLQLEAASRVSKTPAGRVQTVMEYAQAGIITTDETRALLEHPDLESAMSMYTAAQKNIDMCIEAILDGKTGLTPEPFQHLKMGVWRFEQAYLMATNDNAPEEILEALRAWSTMAAFMLSEQNRKQQETAQLQAPQPPPMPPQPMA